jgi:hypothetical protein
MIGGVLALVEEIFGILFGLIFMLLSDMMCWQDYMSMFEDSKGLMVIFGLIGGIFGLLGVLRAVFAIMKQRWLFSIVGTICVIISRFMAIVPLVFGKIAPILIALEGSEFRS